MWKDKRIPGLSSELKRQWDMRVTVISIVIGALRTLPKGIEKKTGGIENQRKNRNHLD